MVGSSFFGYSPPQTAEIRNLLRYLRVLDKTIREPWLKSVGDLNGDGRPDLIVGGARSGGLVVFYNHYPEFRRKVIDRTDHFSTDGEVCDINGDGRNDFVALLLPGPNTPTSPMPTGTGRTRFWQRGISTATVGAISSSRLRNARGTSTKSLGSRRLRTARPALGANTQLSAEPRRFYISLTPPILTATDGPTYSGPTGPPVAAVTIM